MSKPQKLLAGLSLVAGAFALLLWPQESTRAAKDGLMLCYNVILPSLFPFFVLSSLSVDLGFTRLFGRLLEPVMRPLFRISGAGASAFALGCIGGYPIGAKTAVSLYESGQCSRSEAHRLLAFCNNCGPAFLFGVVGVGVFGSSSIGLLLYGVHIAAALCVGIVFRFVGRPDISSSSYTVPPRSSSVRLSTAFTGAVKNSFFNTLTICAFVVFFMVLIRLIAVSGLLTLLANGLAALLSPFLGVSTDWAHSFLAGLLEVSTGVTSLSSGTLSLQLVTASFLLGWGGLSVHFQTLSIVGPSGLSSRTYFAGKALHGLFSALLRAPLSKLIRTGVAVSFPIGEPLPTALTPYLHASVQHTLFLAAAFAIIALLFVLFSQKAMVKRRKLSYNKKK